MNEKRLPTLDIFVLPCAGGLDEIELRRIVGQWRENQDEAQLLAWPGRFRSVRCHVDILNANQV
jgi:hypothetical protein